MTRTDGKAIHRVIEPATLTLDSWQAGTRFASRDVTIGPMLGLTALGMSYNEVPPGKSGCPFHNHHGEDEAFVILRGSGTYRIGAERLAVKAGDILGAPMGGRDNAHQLINDGAEPLVYLAISSKAAIDVCEYPDSDKVLTMARDPATGQNRLRQMVKAAEDVDYWEGE